MNQINPYRHGGEALAFDGFGNRSRSFNGVDDYVSIPDNADIPTGAQTWACWVKFNDQNTFRDLMLHWSGTINNASFGLVRFSDNKLRLYVDSDGLSNTLATFIAGNTNLIAGNWYHVAGVFVPNTSMTLYVNGSADAQLTSQIPTQAFNATVPLTLGGRTDNTSILLEGNLADCRIYDTDLTATEISDLYNGTNVTTNLVGHWLTDDDNVLDAAGSNNGTNYGSKYSYDNPSPAVEFGRASRVFNGTSDRVTIPANVFNGATALTVSAWIKLDSLGINQTVIGRIDNNRGFRLMVRDTNQIDLIWGDGSSLLVSTLDGAVLTSGSWIHVAGTFDNSGDATRYVDGVQTGTIDDLSSYEALSILGDIGIGARVQTTSPLYNLPLDGKIADVRLYDAELTASQISDLYAGVDVTANLVGHYLTDNDDVEDKAGTNDGTNYGSAYSDDNPPMDLIPFGQKSRTFSSDYINTNTGFQSVFQSSFSISTWVRFDDGIPSNNQMLFGNQSATPINRVLIFLDTAGGLTFGYFSNGNQARAEIDQNFANGDTGWFHYTAVVEPTGITIYKDGLVQTLDATDDGDMSAVTMGDYGTDIDCYIGARNLQGTADLKITGNIADFRIYDSALSASDVTKIYNRTDDKSNIHAWYLTNSDDVLDHAGTNDGTNNGSTYSADSPS